MVNSEIAIIAAILISIPVTFFPLHQAQGAPANIHPVFGFISDGGTPPYVVRHTAAYPCWKGDGDVAVSGTNIYTIWECYNHILFTKSNDGGKTFANTMLMSAPDTNPKLHVMNENVSISASGNNVALMWDSNNTGISNPVIRTSSDGGNTFSNIVTLNNTPGGINKPTGSNMTAGSNMTTTAGNSTIGTHGSSMLTTNPTGGTYSGHHGSSILLANPAGSNMATGSNTTGAAGNTTGVAHGSSMPTTNPAGARTHSCPSRTVC